MEKLIALRTFIGQPGEGFGRDNLIRRNDVFTVASSQRADRLVKTGRAQRIVVHTAKDWKARAEKPAPQSAAEAEAKPEKKARRPRNNKQKAVPENKETEGPLEGSDGIPTGEGAEPSSSQAEEAQESSPSNCASEPQEDEISAS